MSAVQQRVLLLRHCLEEEGGSDCIFRREWAYSLNEQRHACVCYDYCDRAIFMLREREGGLFFFWVKHCASSLSSLQVDRVLQVRSCDHRLHTLYREGWGEA